ncbi:MAG: hypothetical protein V3U93_11400 [Alphaproteobacteria bacterium]|jgi:hypothetical protein
MKATRHSVARRCIAALIALAAWPVMTGPARAEPSWTRLGSADFPAHVKAIVFPDGKVLDARNPLCWGKWCAHFTSRTPVAKFVNIIEIEGLECRNPVAGVKSCSISLYKKRKRGALECIISVNKDGPETLTLTSFVIACPQDLRLE